MNPISQEHLALDTDLSPLVARLSRGEPGGIRRIIGIVGAPGAGKSTLAAELARVLGPDRAVVLPMDGFHLHSTELTPAQRLRRGAPDTFDVAAYLGVLARLRDRTEEVVRAPGFDRDTEEPAANVIAIRRRVPIVITEGNYLLTPEPPWRKIRDLLDESWFLEVDPGIRLERLVARHIEFGKSATDATAWAHGTDERNAELIARTRSVADLVIRLR